MPTKLSGLKGLLAEGLQDILDAEKQLVRALPKMAKGAEDSELENAFREHLEVTKGQVQRLEKIFEIMDMRLKGRPCRGMKGIVEEGEEHMNEDHEPGINDSVLCEGGRKVEHYEMVSYESMRAIARQLGMQDAAQLLEETLREEIDTDKKLAMISKRLTKEAGSQKMEQGEETQARQRGRSTSRSASANGRSQRGATAQSSARSSSRSSAKGSTRSSSRQRSTGARGHSAHPLVEHEEIRRWAEDRNAEPSCVRGTGASGDIGMLRLNFPGYSGEESLQEISWDDWFEKFDERNLALMVQDTTAQGQKSNFNKLVSRESAQSKEHRPRARAAR